MKKFFLILVMSLMLLGSFVSLKAELYTEWQGEKPDYNDPEIKVIIEGIDCVIVYYKGVTYIVKKDK